MCVQLHAVILPAIVLADVQQLSWPVARLKTSRAC